jgi:hypothetical protein
MVVLPFVALRVSATKKLPSDRISNVGQRLLDDRIADTLVSVGVAGAGRNRLTQDLRLSAGPTNTKVSSTFYPVVAHA